jgi:peptide/nickel transport system permease protein
MTEPTRTGWTSGFGIEVLKAIGVALGIVIMTFFLIRMIPGDVVDVMGIEGALTYEQQTNLREKLGLSQGWGEQFLIWSGMLIQGDFGVSARFATPVSDLIIAVLPTTLQLALYSLIIGLVVGIALPILAMLYPRSIWEVLVNVITIWSIVVPTFSIGIACVVVFAVWLGWIPAIGNMLVPSLIIGADIAGQIAKMLHEDMKESETANFVRSARAKGLSRARIVIRHIFPNAVTTLLALAGLIMAGLLTGTITMEVVFGLHGIGTLALGAIQGRDYPVIQAVIIWLGLSVVIVNLITDALQRLVDPRLRDR